MSDEHNTIRRVVRLLEAAALRGGRLRFAEAAALLAPIGPNTVARLLRELTGVGVLERTPDRAYALTDKPMFWAASVPRGRDLRAIARPYLVQLNRALDATAALVVAYGGRLTILDRILDPHSPSLLSPGDFKPLNPVWMGGVFLVPRERLQEAAALRGWLSAAPGTTLDVAGARRFFDEAVASGVFVDAGRVFATSARVAAPVVVGGKVVACLGIGASPLRESDFMPRARRLVQAAARAMARRLAADARPAALALSRPSGRGAAARRRD